jgi:serine/threonine-protein kinase
MRIATLALACALGLAACGGDGEPSAQPETGPGAAATVPDVDGAQLADAAQDFADEGLRVSVEYASSEEEEGTVTGQERPAGTELQRGDTVQLTVSTGRAPAAEVPVPDALDGTAAEAQSTLERAGFEVLTIPIPAVTEDVVVYHSPAAGTRTPRGALVLVYAGG